MSSYPDIIAPNGPMGPSLSSLRSAYFEEHGVMPDPELDLDLVNKYWEAVPRGQEGTQGNGHGSIPHPSTHVDVNANVNVNDDDDDDNHHRRHHHQQPSSSVDVFTDGHLELVQRRPDLAPFFGHSPAEIHGGPLPTPIVSTGLHWKPMCTAPTSIRNLHPPGSSPFTAHHANPFTYNARTRPPTTPPWTLPRHRPRRSIQAAFAQAASVQATPTPTPAAAAAATPQARRVKKTKHRWTKTEIARVTYLREKENKTWEEIQQDLGTHTAGSIADKYWYAVRISKGLTK